MSDALAELIEDSKKDPAVSKNLQKPDAKRSIEIRRSGINGDLQKSLELLIERDNPMADAAKKALRRL